MLSFNSDPHVCHRNTCVTDVCVSVCVPSTALITGPRVLYVYSSHTAPVCSLPTVTQVAGRLFTWVTVAVWAAQVMTADRCQAASASPGCVTISVPCAHHLCVLRFICVVLCLCIPPMCHLNKMLLVCALSVHVLYMVCVCHRLVPVSSVAGDQFMASDVCTAHVSGCGSLVCTMCGCSVAGPLCDVCITPCILRVPYLW
jgi:hypothetical protein